VAAQRGDVAAARLALDRGADPECADQQVRRRKCGRIRIRGAATLASALQRRRLPARSDGGAAGAQRCLPSLRAARASCRPSCAWHAAATAR
jgi:hypothetical protein